MLAVVLFHFGNPWLPGGFVGVDVFFVLSGYLITGLLLDELDDRGAVRLRRFYARRVRRLLPASIAVLVAVLAVGWIVLDPVQRASLRWDATLAAAYSANWRFALATGDYFAPGDVPSPLVHYWSLAVEEQFYLLWPAIVFGAHRLATRRRAGSGVRGVVVVSVALGVASLVASIAWVGDPLTYYGLHTRTYQLVAGALLATLVRHRGLRLPDSAGGRAVGSLLGVVGLGVLALLAHQVGDAVRYPGWPGLWVTLATLAVITGTDLTPGGALATALGHRAAAAVGRLSYSLYIWHWPVLVLQPLLAERWGGRWRRLGEDPALAAVMVLLAVASYLLLEQPVRYRLRPRAVPWRVISVGLACSLVASAGAWWTYRPRSDFQERVLQAVDDLAPAGSCPYELEDWARAGSGAGCEVTPGEPGAPTVALVGDSHAQQWDPALAALAEEHGFRYVRATREGCPANDVTTWMENAARRVEVDDRCTTWRHEAFPDLVERYDPDVVLVATRSHVRGIEVDGELLRRSTPDQRAAWTEGWSWTLDTLTAGGATVVAAEALPTLPEPVPACLMEHGEGTRDCDFRTADDRRVGVYNEALRAFDGSRRGRVRVADLSTIPCPGGRCPAVVDGLVVRRDDNHLTAAFTREHADELADWLAAEGARL